MPGNDELFNALDILDKGGDYLTKIESLRKFLGPRGSDVFATEEIRLRANSLGNKLFGADNTDITLDGPPKLTNILEVARRQLAYLEGFKRINDIKEDEDLSKKDLDYLNYFHFADRDSKNSAFIEFCKNTALNPTDKKVQDVFDYLIATATHKKILISTETEQRSKAKINDLTASIQDKQNTLRSLFAQISQNLKNVSEAKQHIQKKKEAITRDLQALNANLKDPTQKDFKKDIQKQIDNLSEQLKLLESTDTKLDAIADRLQHRLSKAHENIKRDFNRIKNKIHQPSDVVFIQAQFDSKFKEDTDNSKKYDSDDLGDFCYYEIEGNKFKYSVANPGTLRDIGEIDLPDGHDINSEETKKYIFNEFVKRGYIATKKYVPFELGSPNVGIVADEKAVNSLDAILVDLEEDVTRCERAIHLGSVAAAKPEKQLHAKLSANTFIDVMSLYDMNFNKDGDPYFRDEIIDEKTQKASLENDPRMKYGLEGEVITRGVMLKPGEINRSVYEDKDRKIVIDTKFVKSKVTNDYSIAKVDFTWQGNLSREEKQLAAFRYARKLLLQYTEGDSKSKITIKASRKQDPKEAAEQANMVYAALLILTSEETAGKNCVKLPSDKLNIAVKGVGPDLFGAWPWKRKQEFISKHFENAAQNATMGQKVTTEYRMLRKSISRDNKQAIISETATDDSQHIPLSKK